MDNFRGIVTMILFVDQKLFVSFSILEIIRLILKWNRRLIVRMSLTILLGSKSIRNRYRLRHELL